MQSRFGDIACELGFITAEQLEVALMIQAQAKGKAVPYRTLGRILLDMGAMTHEQVDQTLFRQSLLHLPARWRSRLRVSAAAPETAAPTAPSYVLAG